MFALYHFDSITEGEFVFQKPKPVTQYVVDTRDMILVLFLNYQTTIT